MGKTGFRRLLTAAAAALAALLLLLVLAWPRPAAPGLLVASASNFLETLDALAEDFTARTGHRVTIAGGASGQLYAQIVQGAPYDIFLSADAARPARLEAEGHAVAGSRHTYALGRLALWSREAGLIAEVRRDGVPELAGSGRIAIADPALAPYGEAAVAALEALGLYDTVSDRLVMAINVNQAFAMAASGAADYGLVALPAVLSPRHGQDGAYWEVPEALHPPIRQDAVLLTRAAEKPAARAFLNYLGSDPARRIVRAHGYEVPE